MLAYLGAHEAPWDITRRIESQKEFDITITTTTNTIIVNTPVEMTEVEAGVGGGSGCQGVIGE